MGDQAAVYLTDDAGQGETFLLSDPGQLQQRSMILSDPETGRPILLVNRQAFLDAGYSVTVDRPTGKPKRRRFGRKGRS